MRLFICIALFLFGFVGGVLASPPLPERKVTQDQSWTSQPKKLEEDAKKIAKEKREIAQKLEALKSDLKVKASDIQKTEKDLTQRERTVSEKKAELERQKKSLGLEKRRIAALVSSLVKMDSIPTETLMLLPQEKSKDLMVSYHTLQALHPALDGQIKSLEKKIRRLKQTKDSLATEIAQKKARTEELKQKRAEVSALVAIRQKEHKATSQAYKQAQERSVQAALTAKSLGDLIENVKKKNDAFATEQAKNAKKRPSPAVKKATARYTHTKKTGTKRLPVSGPITVAYGAKDHLGAKSKGMRIENRSGALVVSPKAGIVKYSGEFLKYGQIVLLEHGKNYHSLIAGLEKIDTVVGQKVSEGEPIANGGKSVYYELRYNGQPVNPLVHLNRL